MSTLAEIEAAVEKLSAADQRALLECIAERVRRFQAWADDPVIPLIGAFDSGTHSTGADAEEIPYGHEHEDNP